MLQTTAKRTNLAPTSVERVTARARCGESFSSCTGCPVMFTRNTITSQNIYVNSVTDFCLWAPPYSDGKNSSVGETEQIEVAWCIKPGYGTRLIPDGTIKGAHFVQTPDYGVWIFISIKGFRTHTFAGCSPSDRVGQFHKNEHSPNRRRRRA
jgi:hypothetical protein